MEIYKSLCHYGYTHPLLIKVLLTVCIIRSIKTYLNNTEISQEVIADCRIYILMEGHFSSPHMTNWGMFIRKWVFKEVEGEGSIDKKTGRSFWIAPCNGYEDRLTILQSPCKNETSLNAVIHGAHFIYFRFASLCWCTRGVLNLD